MTVILMFVIIFLAFAVLDENNNKYNPVLLIWLLFNFKTNIHIF